MSAIEHLPTPPGWYPYGPDRENMVRYWDGKGWFGEPTAKVQNAPALAPHKKPITTGLHLALSIVTLGAWIPIWTLILLTRVTQDYNSRA